MAKLKVSGFDETIQALENLSNSFEKVDGESVVKMTDILSAEFMSTHTPYQDLDDFFSSGGFEIKTNEEFDALDKSKLDIFVSSNTDFSSFEDMRDEAWGIYKSELLESLGF